MRLLFILCLLCLPTLSQAACKGTDLRQSLSEKDRAWINSRVAETPFAEGNHWIATRGNRRIHIVGTMHFNDPRMAPVQERLAPILEASDTLLLEVSPEEKADFQAELAGRTDLTLITEGPSLIDRLSEKDWQELAQIANSRGIPSWMASKMRPWFLAVSLAVPPCLKQDPKRAEGLDMRLGTLATAAGVPIRSLEDPMSVIALMNADPLEEQIRQLTTGLAFLGGDADNFYTLAESYFDEKTAWFLTMNERMYRSSRTLPEHELEELWEAAIVSLLDQRNLAWIPVIEATTADHLVIAVGAAHLPGENGVLNLLQQQGYQLQRAQF